MGLPVITNDYHIAVTGFSKTTLNSTSLSYSIQTRNILNAQQMQSQLSHQLPPATRSILSLVSSFKYDHNAGLNREYPQTGLTEQLYCSQVATLVCSSKAEPILTTVGLLVGSHSSQLSVASFCQCKLRQRGELEIPFALPLVWSFHLLHNFLALSIHPGG